MNKTMYKIKHIPTALYFQPYKYGGSHLSLRGKIYQTEDNGVETRQYGHKTFRASCEKNSRIHKMTSAKLNWIKGTYRNTGLTAEIKYAD